MFQIESIDPKVFKQQTRKATMIIMAMFIVIGFITARLSNHYLGPYSNSPVVVNLLGAFIGLVITGLIVKTFFADKAWMHEAVYAFRLKRHLIMVTNRLRPLQEASERNDITAIKLMRFYHLGLEQMHKFEGNSTALIDLAAEKRELEKKMQELNISLEQKSLNPKELDSYPLQKDS
ncbi:DUF3087 family protein [Thiomicrorhabdus sp.]|uniref:DUF3087 family protein n=1 Tax=Thiomicrorhabdus sp. TaxID=2039724 RepID=UPI0029C7DACE|nr:DUF3087 family protein [Thiomicrorhabdus sp.]